MKHFFADRLIFIKTCLNLLLYEILVVFSFLIVGKIDDHSSNHLLFTTYHQLSTLLFLYAGLALIVMYLLLKPYHILGDLLVTRIFTVRNLFHIIWQNFKLNILLFAFVTAFILITRTSYSRNVIGLLFVSYGLFSVAFTIIFAYITKSSNQREKYTLHLLIVGDNPISATIAQMLRNNPRHNYQLDKDSIVSEKDILSNTKKQGLKHTVIEKNIDVILICSTIIKKQQIDALVDFANQHYIKIKLINHFSYTIIGNPLIHNLNDIPMINLNAFPLERFQNRFLKRTIDIFISTLVIISILSWLTPLLAILLRLESKGGLFYRHPRTGRGGKKFYCLKFRSMYLNDGQEKTLDHNSIHYKNLQKNLPEKVATAHDERITPIGIFLRRRHIDELPQFINIFKGEMSLVGPRPHILDVDAFYQSKIPSFLFRYFVNPGITGLAQILHEREQGINDENIKILEQKVKLDKFYIHHWSLVLDIKIILLTTKYIIFGDPKSV